MLYDKDLNLHSAAEEALRPCLTGMARIRTFAHRHQLAHCLHTYLWLCKTCVIPAGMYASKIWATPYLQQGHEVPPVPLLSSGQLHLKMAPEIFEIHFGSQIFNSFMECATRVWDRA
eukprot:1138663-Pelagomonas_calceolata.AAC.1